MRLKNTHTLLLVHLPLSIVAAIVLGLVTFFISDNSYALSLKVGELAKTALTKVALTKDALTKERVVFGENSKGEKLQAIRIYKKEHALPMRPAVIITGGIHGNEHMGLVQGIADLVDAQDKGFKEFFQAGGIAYLFPEVNPSGVKKGNRYNPFGYDLNRDFVFGRKPSQSESSQLASFLEKDLDSFHARPILAMDYHCCSKSLIYPELKKDNGFYRGQFKKIVGLMQEHVDPEYKGGLTQDFFGHKSHGTLKGYWFKKYGALSFTYEGESPKKEIEKLKGHHAWWKEIMGVVVDIYDTKLAELKPHAPEGKVAGEDPVFYTE